MLKKCRKYINNIKKRNSQRLWHVIGTIDVQNYCFADYYMIVYCYYIFGRSSMSSPVRRTVDGTL